MAARLTEKQKEKIVADYLDNGSYRATARQNGVSGETVKRVVKECGDFEQKLAQKRQDDAEDLLAYMESKRGIVCEIIEKGLAALNSPEKLASASPAQITTALGTLIDKWAPKGLPIGGKDQADDDPITKALKEEAEHGSL